MAQLIRQRTEEAQQEADEKAKEILIDAMRHGATDYVAEYTVSVIKILQKMLKVKLLVNQAETFMLLKEKPVLT